MKSDRQSLIITLQVIVYIPIFKFRKKPKLKIFTYPTPKYVSMIFVFKKAKVKIGHYTTYQQRGGCKLYSSLVPY